ANAVRFGPVFIGAGLDTRRHQFVKARANLLAAGALLGLLSKTPAQWEQGGDSDDKARIDELVAARIQARADKNWAEADRIRDALAAEGIEIMDSAEGATWRRV
ncbi:MAG: hypothetical protein AAFN91_07165, partial [Pseudomonadota bacterium]